MYDVYTYVRALLLAIFLPNLVFHHVIIILDLRIYHAFYTLFPADRLSPASYAKSWKVQPTAPPDILTVY